MNTVIIDGYYLEFWRGRKGHIIKGEQAKEIIKALNNLNVLRARVYFEALGYKFQVYSVEKHGTYKHVTFMRVNK